MSPRFRVLLPVLLLAVVALVGTRRSAALQAAEPRVALVIGNAAYASRPLKNPVNDARAVKAALERLGFRVTLLENAGKNAMIVALREFGRALPAAGVALIYYAGHGVQVEGRNYLIPIGAEVDKAEDVELESVDTGRALAALQVPGKRVGILILDACRDNPFGAGRAIGGGRGLLPLSAPAGTLVAFAAAPGQVAEDNPTGANGLYTEELLQHLQTPGLRIEDVFIKTREGVLRRSGNKQFPKEDSGLVGQPLFLAGGPGAAPLPLPPAVKPAGKASVALVEVTSEPAGARIFLDGQDTGQVTPATLEVDLGMALRRTASLEVRQGGKAGKPEKVVLQAGRQTDVALTLPGLDEPAPGRITRVELGGVPVAFAALPAGEFLMGTDASEVDRIWQRFGWPEAWKQYASGEAPMHRVGVDRFELGVMEVTNELYRKFVQATTHRPPAFRYSNQTQDTLVWNEAQFNGEQQPVVGVSWDDATAFCAWANRELRQQGLPGTIRLPREAEWEYAARGGYTGLNGQARRVFGWGDDLPRGKAGVGNLADDTYRPVYEAFLKSESERLKAPVDQLFFAGYEDGYAQTAPVGQFAANGYGLRDMAGNVCEWCNDYYDSNYYQKSPQRNPENKTNSQFRVLRGGSWNDVPLNLRSAPRNGSTPDYRSGNLGFRLARTIP